MAAARELAKHLKRGDLADSFTARDVHRKGWTMLSTTEDAEAAVELLLELRWLRLLPPDSAGGGRPTQRFAINPRIAKM